MLDESRLPPELRNAASRFNAMAAEVEGKAIRLRKLPLPSVPPPDPAQLAAEAAKPNASAKLRAVADAVRAGKTTWAEVAEGKANDLPEVRALRAETARELLAGAVEAIQSGQEPEDEQPGQPEPPADRKPRRPLPDDPDDYSNESYLA